MDFEHRSGSLWPAVHALRHRLLSSDAKVDRREEIESQ